MKTIPWQPGFTWRKLGFLTQSNSLAYRQVLENNPSWDIITEPPLGAIIQVNDPNSSGQTIGLPTSINTGSAQVSESVFPFETAEEYFYSLSKYSSGALMSVDRTNGWSADCEAAFTGIQ